MGKTQDKNLQPANSMQNIDRLKLKIVLDSYMQQVPQLREHTQRCLKTERWSGNAILMIVDAAFMSIGLNYFTSIVPKVAEFRNKFIETQKIKSLEDLATANYELLAPVWRNKRSWYVAKSIAVYLAKLKPAKGLDDRQALIHWAHCSPLTDWQKDPIGSITGVGINTYQYLRMMGGIDTVMPDKIVKRVIAEILAKAGVYMPPTDMEFIWLVEEIGQITGYQATELCWMTWMIQSEAGLSKIKKYQAILPMI